jgi:hypothetical protein
VSAVCFPALAYCEAQPYCEVPSPSGPMLKFALLEQVRRMIGSSYQHSDQKEQGSLTELVLLGLKSTVGSGLDSRT